MCCNCRTRRHRKGGGKGSGGGGGGGRGKPKAAAKGRAGRGQAASRKGRGKPKAAAKMKGGDAGDDASDSSSESSEESSEDSDSDELAVGAKELLRNHDLCARGELSEEPPEEDIDTREVVDAVSDKKDVGDDSVKGLKGKLASLDGKAKSTHDRFEAHVQATADLLCEQTDSDVVLSHALSTFDETLEEELLDEFGLHTSEDLGDRGEERADVGAAEAAALFKYNTR